MSLTARTSNRTGGSMLDIQGGLLFVDATFGDNDRAMPNRQDLPYATLVAASAAALSGETVIVLPGTYDEVAWVKNGVNWYFHMGAEVVYTGAADTSLISDGADGTAGDLICSIMGYGKFKNHGSRTDGTLMNACVNLSDAQSVVYIEGLEISCTVNSDTTNEAIKVTLATLETNVALITSSKDVAIRHISGVTKIGGQCRVTSTLSNSPAVDVDGDGLVWTGLVTVIPHSGASVSMTAADAVNMRTYGVVVTNTALDMDITETVGAVNVDAQVT